MIVVIMGVAGSGKSLITSLLARELDWSYVDADDLHPPGNVEKMSSGVPLTDEDREPWLLALRRTLLQAQASSRNVALACSALRRDFRSRLTEGLREIHFVYLHGARALFEERLLARREHFFKPELLDSQLAVLQEPEDAIVIDAAAAPAAIVEMIKSALNLRGSIAGG